MRLFVLGVMAVRAAQPPAAAPFKSIFDTKPIEQMGFGELLDTGREALNNLTVIPLVRGNVHLLRLQEVMKSLSKTLPLVTYDSSITPIERGVDGLIHNALHPVEFLGNEYRGASWDFRHITERDSAYGLLRGLVIIMLLYFIIGFIIMAKYYKAEGPERIPHAQFWMAYPSLVMDGINYARDQVGITSDKGNSTSYERIADTSTKFHGSRDTFSQFEPI
jgi:hypothetical protein